MIRLLICGTLIALFAYPSKPAIEEPTTMSSLPDSTINMSFACDCNGVTSQTVTKTLKEQKLKQASHRKSQTDIAKNAPSRVTIKAILRELDTKPLQELSGWTGLDLR